MPFKSKAQRRYLHANEPELASRWEHEYSAPRRLPERTAKRASSKRASRRKMTRC